MKSTSTSNNSCSHERVWLEISLGAITRNFQRMLNHANKSAIMPVLKANAYGIGALPIATCLKTAGANAFGVASPNEAIPLLPLELPIWILSGLLPHETPKAVANGLILPITDLATANRISAEALRQNRTAQCHIVVDTGMGRIGIPFHNAYSLITEIMNLPGMNVIGLGSHFPDAGSDFDFSNEQITKFISLLGDLERRRIAFAWRHIANSDALRSLPRAFASPFNLVRTGLNLYGVAEGANNPPLGLESVITLKTRLISVRNLPAGHSIGYGRTHRLEHNSTLGTLAIGYADGVPFALGNKGSVIVRGKRCPILGRISMDYTVISLQEAPDAQPGDEAICLGHDLPVTEWASLKGSIPYDILCAFGPRIERIHLPD